MPDTKITALTAIGANPIIPSTFPIPMVDLTDTSMAASGTTKKVTVNQILGAGGTATLASATITGAATVGTTLGVTGVSTFAAGTALLPALTTTGDTNTGIYYPAADTFAVTTGGTERYRVDSSGNVGIGVTPSAWGAGYTALQNRQTCWFATSARDLNLGANVYVDGVGYKYIATAAASNYVQYQGVHSWYNAASGTAGTTITDFATAKMTLDASGNLLVGSGISGARLAIRDAGNNDSYIGYGANNDMYLSTGASGVHYFRKAAASAAMTLDASGNLLVGTTVISPSINGAGAITAKGLAGITLLTVSALATDYALPIGAFAGILTIRSNGAGGSAVWMLDPNAGAVQISNNIVGRTITFTFSGGSWKLQQTVGTVPSTYNYLVLATQ